MKTVILGYGKSGQAVEEYLTKRGVETLCVDRKPTAHILSDQSPPNLEGVDTLVKSPGILLSHPWVVAARQQGIKIIGEIDLALKELREKKKKVIAVTGSNGKTTTVLALKQVLGERALVAGNIGRTLLSAIDESAEIFIVELSSFQLETIDPHPSFDGAVILNITPNHLDHHPTMEDYISAKWRIQECLKPQAPLFCQKDFLKFKEKVETIFFSSYRGGELRYVMRHDIENFAAVYALCLEMGVSDEHFASQIVLFEKPPHRVEFVAELQEIAFFNDSKASSVDAVLKGVEAMTRPVVLIAGGVDKGGLFSDWLPLFEKRVKSIFAIGQAAGRICRELDPVIRVKQEPSLEVAVKNAFKEAKKGDCVLLSPGCSSFDQFQSFEHRGEEFKRFVHALGSEI